MKLKFVKGEYIYYGQNVIYLREINNICSGYFQGRGKENTKIVIVKQKNKLKMLKTLVHELMHAFVFTFISKESNCKYHDWIDRHNDYKKAAYWWRKHRYNHKSTDTERIMKEIASKCKGGE